MKWLESDNQPHTNVWFTFSPEWCMLAAATAGDCDEAWEQWPAGRNKAMTESENLRALVSVVDDDESVREAVPDLLGEFGFATCAFASAEDFLGFDGLGGIGCLVLDVAMPGMTGPELQIELKRLGVRVPIVFITAQADETLFPRLMAQGAVACLLKPFSETALLDAVTSALARSGA
jgi:FixJ family two-component response regulator